jgi:hypothetical protein
MKPKARKWEGDTPLQRVMLFGKPLFINASIEEKNELEELIRSVVNLKIDGEERKQTIKKIDELLLKYRLEKPVTLIKANKEKSSV